MRLKAKRTRKTYKSELAYIRAVYQHNKKKIDRNISEEWVQGKSNYEGFRDLALDIMSYTNPKTGKKYTAEEALKRLARSKDLNKNWETGDVFGRNFHEVVKKNKEVKEIFYQHEGIKKIDYKSYNFLGYYNYKGTNVLLYNYGDSYFLEEKSPKAGAGASLQYMSGYQYQRSIGVDLKFVQKRKR